MQFHHYLETENILEWHTITFPINAAKKGNVP